MRSAAVLGLLVLGALGACASGSRADHEDAALPDDAPAVVADAPQAIDAPPAIDGASADAPSDGALVDAPTDAAAIDAAAIDAAIVVDAAPDAAAMVDAAMVDAAVVIDAAPDAPAGPLACNPNTQAPCGTGEKCGWVVNGSGVGASLCVPNGTVALGGSCAITSNGASNCVRGSECVDSTCKPICNATAGQPPACTGTTTCQQYLSLFDEPGKQAGVCDPQCDPLTQRRGSDSAEACGSPLPASPSKGCYTGDLTSFTCASVVAGAGTHTDRTPALGNGTTTFINGCAPGFIPVIRDSSSSTTVICSGTCAPKKTDSTLPGNALGDATALGKLPGDPAPLAGNATCAIGKKGSEAAEDCRFLWWFNFDANNNPVPGPYNDTLGICLGYTHYDYDHDNNTTTPRRPFPACASLPPKNGTPGIDGTAEEWGCYNSVDTNARVAPHAIDRRGDLRLMLGGRAWRHILQ